MELRTLLTAITGFCITVNAYCLSVTSIDPADGSTGIKADTNITVTFNVNIKDPAGYANPIGEVLSLEAIKDKNGNDLSPPSPIPLDWAGISRSGTNPSILIVDVPSDLDRGSVFKLTITTVLLDTNAAPLDTLFTMTFSTIWNKLLENTLFGADNIVKVRMPFETMPADGYIEIIEDPLNNTNISSRAGIEAANAAASNSANILKFPLLSTLKEFNLFHGDSSNALFLINFTHTANIAGELPEITLPYTDLDNDGKIDGTSPVVSESTLSMYRLDINTEEWIKIGGSVDTVNNTVTARTNRLTVFILMGSIYTDLNQAFAYPVPFQPGKHADHSSILFTKLTPGSGIKIYTIAGELVRELIADEFGSDVSWNTRNASGRNVVSGVYLYYISGNSTRRKGKLIIIR